MYQIILASKSPRRIALLQEIGLEFVSYSPKFDEKEGEQNENPEEIATHNAIGKAIEAVKHFKNALIIGVDTVVESNGHILGKPKDREDAKRLIRLISGTTHRVITAICVINTVSGKTITGVTETFVTMEKIDEEKILAYVNSGEGDDKAGAYAIQGKGALFIKKIEGDYFNVVGLPIYTLKKMLKEFKVDLDKFADSL